MKEPFSIGRALGTSLSILFSGAGVFVLMTLLIHVPWLAYTVWVAQRMTTASVASDMQIHAFVALAVSVFLHPFAAGAITYGVLMQLRGKPAGLGACLSVALSRLLPVLGVSLLAGLAIGFASILLVVPGLILATHYYVATPVVVVEGVGGTAALRRSAELTYGSRWHIFALFLIVIVVNIGVTQGIRMAVVGSVPTVEQLRLFTMVNTGVAVLLETFYAVVVAVAYHQLRVAREGVDIESIASAFD